MITTMKVSSKGQIVIPEAIRRELGIKEGTRLVVIERGKKIIIEKEKDFEEEMERRGWLGLAEKSLAKIWDNPEDDVVWSKYL